MADAVQTAIQVVMLKMVSKDPMDTRDPLDTQAPRALLVKKATTHTQEIQADLVHKVQLEGQATMEHPVRSVNEAVRAGQEKMEDIVHAREKPVLLLKLKLKHKPMIETVFSEVGILRFPL